MFALLRTALPTLALATLLTASPLLTANTLGQVTPVLTVDAAANRHPISPDVYGIAAFGLDTSFAQEIRVPNVRSGGDGVTRYNWLLDSSNAGFDWFFMGGDGVQNPVPGASMDTLIQTYTAVGARPLLTIPIIPYVNGNSEWNCSFPQRIYGDQQSYNPYVHPNGDNCGNSIAVNGTQLTDKNIYANHVDNTVALQAGWVQHLIDTWDLGARGGVAFYQLDNEPFGWGNTHRDIEPNGATYPTITSLGQRYAAMVKQADPTAQVLGPSDFTLGGWVGDTSTQNGLWAGQFYLQQMAKFEADHGIRILDFFDEHYYPQFSDPASQLAATQTLWSTTFNGGTWVEQYDFRGPMQLIPRFRQWIADFYPGTKLAFSEYSIDSGGKSITDALAEADMLGIFGREAVDFANMWNVPAPGDPTAYAFRLFRNYDGRGAQFGELGVAGTSTDQARLSIYASERTADQALTIVVINKTTAPIATTLSLANFRAGSAATAYGYTAANLKAIVPLGTLPVLASSLAYSFPAYSATVFEIPGAAAVQGKIAPGTYRLLNQMSRLALDSPAAAHACGRSMIQSSPNGTANQRWVVQAASGGFYIFQSEASGLILTDPNTSVAGGKALEQRPRSNTNAQLWSITPGEGGGSIIRNRATGLVFDGPSPHPGSVVHAGPANLKSRQVWTLE